MMIIISQNRDYILTKCRYWNGVCVCVCVSVCLQLGKQSANTNSVHNPVVINLRITLKKKS